VEDYWKRYRIWIRIACRGLPQLVEVGIATDALEAGAIAISAP